MSIWQSNDSIGDPLPGDEPRGVVLSYAQGFSNHYPDDTGEHERPASVGTASIPAWCVPGHDEEDEEALGPWLRLDLYAPESVNHWERDDAGKPVVRNSHASVVLDEAAAKALMGDLLEWLTRPKLHPQVHVDS